MDTSNGAVLVIGAGIGGIRSALDLAELGRRVILMDNSARLTGFLGQLDCQFPNDHCGMCRMLPMLDRDASSQFCLRKGFFHERVELMLSTELVDLTGDPGQFVATVRRVPPLVDQQKCIGCGDCWDVCPVDVKDEFNSGLSARNAIYRAGAHSTPNMVVIDAEACTRCGKCQEVCPTGAINLGLEDRRNFKVLVVDDELIMRESMKEWLLDDGFGVDVAGSGEEAIEFLSRDEYGLMLLDVKMPGMDGVEVLKVARDMRPAMQIMMMTAYGTVETAVEAMKYGARDYVMKPFDPELVMGLVKSLYEATMPISEEKLEVGAVIVSTGFGLARPDREENVYGYGTIPGVYTSLEFERLLSGTGPTAGRLMRPDGQPVDKVAWLQCAGSRNIPEKAEFCSSVCCMFSIKEALLARKATGGRVEAAIFYMDMRTFGKDYQRYRDAAELEHGVRFVRSRVHSVESDALNGGISLTYVEPEGTIRSEGFDMVVLATGQRPPKGTEELAEKLGLEVGESGFCRLRDTEPSCFSRDGFFAAGSSAGARDISDSVIQASAASVSASALLQSKGSCIQDVEPAEIRDVSRELPNIAVVLCTCEGKISRSLTEQLGLGEMGRAIAVDKLCSKECWDSTIETLKSGNFNRVVVGACLPHAYGLKVRSISKGLGLGPALVNWVDVRSFVRETGSEDTTNSSEMLRPLQMAVARVREAEPRLPSSLDVVQQALVVGGGIAGMTAALMIADHGFDVKLVEKTPVLGGNVRHIYRTLQGFSPQELLEKLIVRVKAHSRVEVLVGSEILDSHGNLGHFITAVRNSDGQVEAFSHGVAILATGGSEAGTESYCYGQSDAILTQHEFEDKLQAGSIEPSKLNSVVMIQCVGSREGDRNYCSRICCASALKNALHLKQKNPDVDVYVFYRDMMAYGFLESSYTEARRAGVVFIQYEVDRKPSVTIEDGRAVINGHDHILGRTVRIYPDVVVLGTGIVPADNSNLADVFRVNVNSDGFFAEADYKWRPVDLSRDGVFVCGIAHSPRSIDESILMAEASAQRALRVLSHKRLMSGGLVAEVRHSLCSLCEQCISACPYGVRWKDEDEEIIAINQAACQGCGACAAACPNGASVLRGYQDRQVLAMIDAAIGS